MNGGGDTPTYTLNGFGLSDSQAANLLGSGAAVQCPNNDCTGIQAQEGPGGTTVIQQWAPGSTTVVPGGQVCSSVAGVSSCTDTAASTSTTSGYWQTLGTVGNNWNLVPLPQTLWNAGRRGFYFNPIDQAVNPYHPGGWSFRHVFRTVCSPHLTVNRKTREERIHTDTINPVPLWPVLFGPGGAVAVWGGTFTGHLLLDMGGLYPASEACR